MVMHSLVMVSLFLAFFISALTFKECIPLRLFGFYRHVPRLRSTRHGLLFQGCKGVNHPEVMVFSS